MNLKKFSLMMISIYVVMTLAKNVLDIKIIGDLWALIVVVVFVSLSCKHSFLWYGRKNTLVFFMITFVVSWSFESISIATGFPFGFYTYSEILGPRLGNVPLLIMPAYFSLGYLSWVSSHVIARRTKSNYTKWDMLVVPLIAAFGMTIWDLTFDPVSSTINNMWCWRDGGAYFGVPIQNFLGWFLCVFVIFSVFYFYIKGKKNNQVDVVSKEFWLYPVIAYTVFSFDTITKPILIWRGYVHDSLYPIDTENGLFPYWHLKDIYNTMALIALFTMVLYGFVVLISILRNQELK